MGIRNISGYDDTLDSVIVALCRDFERRETAVGDGRCSTRTSMEYKYINSRLLSAAMEIVGDDARAYIHEIGERVGYAYSAIDQISESTYKQAKKEVKLNIAKKLHMMD